MEFFYNLNLTNLDKLFLCLIGIVALVGIILIIKNNKNGAMTCASLVTSLGVLGTFIGIFIGLSKFDVNFIEESVPTLLEGMRFAFLTSIAGMIASLFIKIISSIVESKYNQKEEVDSFEELFENLSKDIRELNITLRENNSKNDKTLLDLGEAFKSNQYELISEMKSLNSSLNNKQDKLINEFNRFADQMTKSNTDALIDALNGVIKDFNENITEQFGENFKELNVAVSKLLDWQESYKETIEFTIKQLNKTVDSIKLIEISMNNITSKSNKLVETSYTMDKVLNEVCSTQMNIETGLSSIVEISDQAKNSIPNLDKYYKESNYQICDLIKSINMSTSQGINSINGYMNDLTNNIDSISEEAIKTVVSNIDKSNITLERQISNWMDSIHQLTSEINKTIPKVSKEFNDNYNTFSKSLTDLSTNTTSAVKLSTEQITAQCETLTKTNSDLREKLQVQINKISEDTLNQITEIIDQMEKIFANRADKVNDLLEHELKTSLNSLGSQLATLSEKFVADYLPLTERLKEVVDIAKGV